MKSVGEVMAIGRTFKEALLKAVRALDTGRRLARRRSTKDLTQRLVTPHPERLSYVRYALRQGYTVKQLAKVTSMDPWFLYQLKEINDMQLELEKHPMDSIRPRCCAMQTHGLPPTAGWRRFGGSATRRSGESKTPAEKHASWPVYKPRDTCAAEFESYTPYLYSTYEEEDEAAPTTTKKVIILAAVRIASGRAIEFTIAAATLRSPLSRRRLRDRDDQLQSGNGFDRLRHQYRLYFEPLTLEDVFFGIRARVSGGASVGVIVQSRADTPESCPCR